MENICQNPEHELFMFSVLMGRFEMAKLFLKEGHVSKMLKMHLSKSFENIKI